MQKSYTIATYVLIILLAEKTVLHALCHWEWIKEKKERRKEAPKRSLMRLR